MRRGRRRGYTLIEAMVATAVGAITVMVAAEVGQVLLRSNKTSGQTSDRRMRQRILSEQLRADIRLAGLGSTGAVGIDPNSPVLGAMSFQTPGGTLNALPAIAGVNASGPVAMANATVRATSDVIQLVVPNPSTRVVTSQIAARGSPLLQTLNAAALGTCPLVYIHDHTNANATGRTQLAWIRNPTLTTIPLDMTTLQFTVAAGASVSCARVSTYWVDNNDILHRTDLTRGGAVRVGGPVWGSSVVAPVSADIAATGVMHMQIAYRMSPEAFRIAGLPIPADPANLWIFQSGAATLDTRMVLNPSLWFEVRAVRIHLLLRNQTVFVDGTEVMPATMREDGDPGNIPRGFRAEWMTTADVAMNLRIFDASSAATVAAEPY